MNESLRLKLFAERKARLARLLRMDAPDSIMADECLLVIRAYAGGSRWDSLRFVLNDILRRGDASLRLKLELLARRVLGRHTWGAVFDEESEEPEDLEETGVEECCYCDARRERP